MQKCQTGILLTQRIMNFQFILIPGMLHIVALSLRYAHGVQMVMRYPPFAVGPGLHNKNNGLGLEKKPCWLLLRTLKCLC